MFEEYKEAFEKEEKRKIEKLPVEKLIEGGVFKKYYGFVRSDVSNFFKAWPR